MTETVTSEEIVSAFDDLGLEVEEPKTIDRLASLCDLYKINADKISTEYLAFVYKKKYDSTQAPSLEMLDEYENDVLKNLHQHVITNRKIMDVTNLLNNVDESMELVDEDDMLNSYSVKRTPKRQQRDGEGNTIKKRIADSGQAIPFSPTSFKDEVSTPSSRRYRSRTNAGGVLIKFGDQAKGSEWDKSQSGLVIVVKPFAEHLNVKEPYQFMFEGLREKAGSLDEIICRMGDFLQAKHQLDEPQSFLQNITEPVHCLGRVCCDSPDGRLNQYSLVLQGTQDICEGKAIAMDPQGLPRYSFFPGQIVNVLATNPNGAKIYPSKLYSDSCIELAKTSPSEVDESISVVVASGPFTTSDNLEYEPLKDLLKYINKNKPHLVVLSGALVNDNFSLIEDLNETYEAVFDRVLSLIMEATKDLSTQIVLVSSSHDLAHPNVYPSPPYRRFLHNGQPVSNNIHMMSDPCMFNVDGVIIGATSTDVLFHIGKEEISFPRSDDRLKRLACHLLQQRSFYPLFPPNEDINIDFEQFEASGQMEVQPHLLILPSDLLHFFKEVNGGIIMNPNRLSKREAGGVFSRLLIQPKTTDDDDEPFSKRVKAEVVRI